MKKDNKLIMLGLAIVLASLISSCSNEGKDVTLHFYQYDCFEDGSGDVTFSGECLKECSKTFEYNHLLTNEEIDDFTIIGSGNTIDYVIPHLSYGRYFFTSFYLNKNNPCFETCLRATELKHDLNLYFGVIG